MKRLIIIAVLSADAIGSRPVGGGPHGFGQLRFHQITEPAVHNTDDTSVAANARWRHRWLDAVATATAASIGKYAGRVARHWPTLVATPLPPSNPFQTG